MWRPRLLLPAALLAAAPMLCQAGDDLTRVEQDITAKWKDYKTMTAKVAMEMNMVQDMVTSSDGTFEYLVDGEKEKYRMESSTQLTFSGQTLTSRQTVVCDGDVIYALNDSMGQKTMTKQRTESRAGRPGGAKMLQELKQNHDLKLLPDEKVGAEDVYVIEATSRSGGMNSPKIMRLHFSKKSAVLLKVVGQDADGATIMTTTYRDVQINPPIDRARFDFAPPAGIPLIDQTK